MWYTLQYEKKDALMFFTGDVRSIHFTDDEDNPMHIEYIAWLEAGNTPELWEAE